MCARQRVIRHKFSNLSEYLTLPLLQASVHVQKLVHVKGNYVQAYCACSDKAEGGIEDWQKSHFLLIYAKGVILSTTNSTSSLAVGELPRHHMPALPRFPYCLLKTN